MKAVAASVLRTAAANNEVTEMELAAADQIQRVINNYFWTNDVTNVEVELVLRVLALKSPSVELTVNELLEWHVGIIRTAQRFGSGRTLSPGDIVLSSNLHDGDMQMVHRVWGPRLVHIGVIHEDDIDPL